jgi:hypothetical protein
MGGSNGEHHAHGGLFDNRAKSLIVVHTRALREPPEDPASLVVVKSPVRERLVGKNPFAGDDVGATRPWSKVSGPIAQKGPIFFLHCHTPIWIDERGADKGWDQRWWHRSCHGSEGEGCLRHLEPHHGTGGHPVQIDPGSHGHSYDRMVCGC